MMTSTISWVEHLLDNITINSSILIFSDENDTPVRSKSFLMILSKWILRLTSIFIVFMCPWANFKLVQFFQTHTYHKESSVKWYIIFKAIFDTIYMLISIPVIFFLTFGVDIIHENFLTCKLITYVHYLADDLISLMLTLVCIDRMIRITCGYRLRTRFSLTVCIIMTSIFMIINIHHIIRLQHVDGFCQKSYLGIFDYDFDIYYSFIYTLISWIIIFITLINLTVSVYCDRARRIQLKKQQQQQNLSKVFLNGANSMGSDSDRAELIHSTDDWEDSTTVTIEQNNIENRFSEQEDQDNIDLQLTKCVLIISAIFLACNLPNFILFIMRFILHGSFASIGYVFIYISLFPLLIAHTISYFVFNHLAARIFPSNSS